MCECVCVHARVLDIGLCGSVHMGVCLCVIVSAFMCLATRKCLLNFAALFKLALRGSIPVGFTLISIRACARTWRMAPARHLAGVLHD